MEWKEFRTKEFRAEMERKIKQLQIRALLTTNPKTAAQIYKEIDKNNHVLEILRGWDSGKVERADTGRFMRYAEVKR